MSFLGNNELKKLLSTCIEPYNPRNIKSASYELTLGNEVFLTDSKDGKKEILSATNSQVIINPGQFALLLTQEKVTVPKDKIAFISIKAGEKFKGLVNVSGFHVDPGFCGQLLFSVYNAGPSAIVLDMGKPYFIIWYSELTSQLANDEAYNSKKHQGQSTIPTNIIEVLKSGELASPNAILKKIREIRNDLNTKIERVNSSLSTNQIIFGIVITIIVSAFIPYAVELYKKESKFNEGYQSGLKEKMKVIKGMKQPLDSIIKHDVDSILSLKLKNVKSNQ